LENLNRVAYQHPVVLLLGDSAEHLIDELTRMRPVARGVREIAACEEHFRIGPIDVLLLQPLLRTAGEGLFMILRLPISLFRKVSKGPFEDFPHYIKIGMPADPLHLWRTQELGQPQGCV